MALSRPTEAPAITHAPLTFPKIPDRSGQAKRRKKCPQPLEESTATMRAPSTPPSTQTSERQPAPTAAQSVIELMVEETLEHLDRSQRRSPLELTTISRTTEWRRRKAGLSVEPERTYRCSSCGEALSGNTTHLRFQGKKFCPQQNPGVDGQAWLQQQKEAARLKKL